MKAAAQTLLVMVWLPPVPEFSCLQLLSDHHCTTHLLNQQNSIILLLEFAKKLLVSTCKAVKSWAQVTRACKYKLPKCWESMRGGCTGAK